MAEENIEDKIKKNEVKKEGKNSDKPKKEDLEHKTKTGFFSIMKKFSPMDWFKIGVTGAISTALSGGFLLPNAILNVATTMGSYAIGTYLANKKKGVSPDEIKSGLYLGGYITPIIYNLFKTVDSVKNHIIKTLGGLSLGIPLFTLLFLPIRHFVKNYNPLDKTKEFFKRITYEKGGILTLPYEFYKKALKGQYKKSLVETWKYMSIPNSLIWNFVPLDYMLPASAFGRTLYKFSQDRAIEQKDNNIKKQEPKENYSMMPQFNPA